MYVTVFQIAFLRWFVVVSKDSERSDSFRDSTILKIGSDAAQPVCSVLVHSVWFQGLKKKCCVIFQIHLKCGQLFLQILMDRSKSFRRLVSVFWDPPPHSEVGVRGLGADAAERGADDDGSLQVSVWFQNKDWFQKKPIRGL